MAQRQNEDQEMQKQRETAGLLVLSQHALIVLGLLPFKTDGEREKAKEQVKASMYDANSTHATQTYGVNTVSIEDGMAYIHLGQWSAVNAQALSEKLIERGVAHSITWNDANPRTQGGHHYRFNNLGDLIYRKTTQNSDCMLDGAELLQYANEHGAEALQEHLTQLVESKIEPSWDNQSINGNVYLAKYRKIIDQKSANAWKVVNQLHTEQFGINPSYKVDQSELDAIKPNDRVLIGVEHTEDFAVRVEVLSVDADGIIEAELKSESWENDYNSVGDRFFLSKSDISAISPR